MTIFKNRLLLLFTFISVISIAQNEPEIGVIEHLGEDFPKNVKIINEKGDTISLISLVDKPTVLNFVYYRCPGICSPLMSGISEVMDKSDLIPGKDYQVLTISFDPSETIDLAIKKKKNYFSSMQRKEEAENGWLFFVSDSASIVTATNAVGFKYKKTGNDYLHAASVMILSPEGKIVRYLNGIYFLPFEWKMALIEASEGKMGPSINKILQYCYSYDPEGQAYRLNITRVVGAFIIFFGILLFIVLVTISRTKKSKK